MLIVTVEILAILSTFGRHCSVIARSFPQRTSSKDETSCFINGKSYAINSSFITCTSNHSMHCYCMMGGVASCMDLCPQAEPVQCPPGTTLQEDEEPVGTDDTPCSCKRQYCVPAKVVCYSQDNDKKYKVGETFTLGNCSQTCRCNENGQILCGPICPKIKCPKGTRPSRGKGAVKGNNGCYCQIQDCIQVPRRFCRVDGRRFRRGRVFITQDCQHKCRCRKNGVPRCTPLCKAPKGVPKCGLDEKLVEISDLFAGGRCSCVNEICVPNRSKFVRRQLDGQQSKSP